MQKERILYIDRLRGVNILLVVMVHALGANVQDGLSSGVAVWGSTFRMPLFMFLCGYIANKVIKPKIFDNYGAFLLKKCRTLLVPFFAWSLLVSNFFFTKFEGFNFSQTIVDLLTGGGLWFLLFLFYVTLIYSLWLFISSKWNTTNKILFDLVIWGALLAILLFACYINNTSFIRLFILFFVFYFIGVFVSKYKFFTTILMKRETFTLGLLTFLTLVSYYETNDASPMNLIIKIICAISAIAVFYYFIRNIKWNPSIDKYIRLWGVNSLIIYVTHFHVVNIFLFKFIPSEINQAFLFIAGSILAILISMVSMIIYQFIKMSNVLNFLLYGSKLNLPFSKKEATLNT